MNLIEANDLSVAYGGNPVLDGVDVHVEAGEIVTLVGPNGSGKSTLVKALLGVVRPDRGRVVRKPGLRIGYVPQRLHIDPSLPLTVARFLSLPVRHGARKVEKVVGQTGIAGLEQRQMSDLSGGQFQRVLLARALLTDPELLLLDEPTQGLDQPGEAAFYRLLEEVRQALGCGVFLVSHDLHVVMSASDRVICLNHHVCCEGTPNVVRDAPEYRALFGHGTQGALALYQHDHDHHHHDHDHDHGDKDAG
ncbi:metal ABC transporter ATP-binding protein [Maritimibacter fusiformis]|uniref:Metal ABC transporter ATP-binding protein n=1 Tax=Maritimibacter fusiformis TaxID=2603819 RepID=A0A5D0RHN8_9RHOB|nr:metal ABC transporter ATP-binding protein [Maritimibacter fusiformis]TYB80441.1 metal ABC transporter ATP-binding protein [Maritimibacter fusiformis]